MYIDSIQILTNSQWRVAMICRKMKLSDTSSHHESQCSGLTLQATMNSDEWKWSDGPGQKESQWSDNPDDAMIGQIYPTTMIK